MKRKQPDDTPERNETDSEEVLRRLAEAERNIKKLNGQVEVLRQYEMKDNRRR